MQDSLSVQQIKMVQTNEMKGTNSVTAQLGQVRNKITQIKPNVANTLCRRSVERPYQSLVLYCERKIVSIVTFGKITKYSDVSVIRALAGVVRIP